MSGGDWDPSFDLLHQIVDAIAALEELPPAPWPSSTPYEPDPRDPMMPRLMEHRLPDGTLATEPTSAEYDEILRAAHIGRPDPRQRAWFEWRYARQLAWLNHFKGLDPGPCSCPKKVADV